MYYDDTEAEHLADIADYDFFEPYDDWEKAMYLDAKAATFSKRDVGKWVVIQNSRRNRSVMPTMYLADRRITKRFWWSPDAGYAMIFDKQSAAEYQAKRYKYNKARVKQITPGMANREYFESEYEN